jgi:hypothetical protein
MGEKLLQATSVDGQRPSIKKFAQCPLLAQSGHGDAVQQCPLSGEKRTLEGSGSLSASDPKRTSKTRRFWIACKPETHLFSTETYSMALL